MENLCGRFEAPGTVLEAEIWLPLHELKVAAKRDTISCVVLTLDEAEFADVDLFSKRRLDLELVAMWERDYYGQLFEFYRPVRTITWVTALLIASGGLVWWTEHYVCGLCGSRAGVGGAAGDWVFAAWRWW